MYAAEIFVFSACLLNTDHMLHSSPPPSPLSLFQALCQCGRLKKRVGDERNLVEKEGTFDILTQEMVSFFKWAE